MNKKKVFGYLLVIKGLFLIGFQYTITGAVIGLDFIKGSATIMGIVIMLGGFLLLYFGRNRLKKIPIIT
jgi:uncharacterized membrane protein